MDDTHPQSRKDNTGCFTNRSMGGIMLSVRLPGKGGPDSHCANLHQAQLLAALTSEDEEDLLDSSQVSKERFLFSMALANAENRSLHRPHRTCRALRGPILQTEHKALSA